MATVVCLGHSCFPTKITVDQCRMYTTDMTFQIVCGGKWFLAKMTTMRDSFYVLFSMSFNNLSSFCCFPTQFTSPDTVHTGVLLVTFHGRAYIRARNLPAKKTVFIYGRIKRKTISTYWNIYCLDTCTRPNSMGLLSCKNTSTSCIRWCRYILKWCKE